MISRRVIGGRFSRKEREKTSKLAAELVAFGEQKGDPSENPIVKLLRYLVSSDTVLVICADDVKKFGDIKNPEKFLSALLWNEFLRSGQNPNKQEGDLGDNLENSLVSYYTISAKGKVYLQNTNALAKILKDNS